MSNESKGAGNSYTAEFWEYDPRIGRRWNVDPVEKEYESPYAAFGNNPIWNIDPNGADTAKYISDHQVVDAIKIGYNQINTDITNKKYNVSNNRDKELAGAIMNYFDQHQDMTFNARADFYQTVYDYFNGLNEVAFASAFAWENLGKRINNSNLSDRTNILQTATTIQAYNGFGLSVVVMGANAAMGIAAGSIGIEAGPGPRAPFKSNIQAPLNTPLQVSFGGRKVPIFRGAAGDKPLFELKAGEYKYTDQTVRGLSVNVNATKLTNQRGAAYQITQMPKGLKIVQKSNDLGHFEIVPTSKLSQEDFQKLLNQIKYTKTN